MNKIIPLHIHSEKSVLDGVAKVKDYAKHIKSNEGFYDLLMLSEHGNLLSLMEGFNNSKKYDIKFATAMEIYLKVEDDKKMYHLLVFGNNYDSYKEIIKINNNSVTSGQEYKGKSYWTLEQLGFLKHSYVSTACIGGYTNIPIAKDSDFELAEKRLLELIELIGKDSLMLEYQCYRDDQQRTINSWNNKMRRKHNLKSVVSSDSHVISKEDNKYIKAVRSIGWKTKIENLEDENSSHLRTLDMFKEENKKYNMNIPEEVFDEFVEFSRNFYNNIESYNLHHKQRFGRFNEDVKKEFENKVEKGMKEKGLWTNEYISRYKKEKDIIFYHKVPDYFLRMQDFVSIAKNNDIMVGADRGSGNSSVCNYALGITETDPIKHNLLFERFYDKHRKEYPDM